MFNLIIDLFYLLVGLFTITTIIILPFVILYILVRTLYEIIVIIRKRKEDKE